jgi:hydroxymethylbilane synthase
MSVAHIYTADRPLRIATRGSALALAQVALTEAALKQAYADMVTERVIIQTSGDRFQDRPLAEIGGKALFTREIDEALLKGEADIAVHSLKDVPGDMPDSLVLAGCLKREDVCDVLFYQDRQLASVAELPENCVLATSSPRRALQAQAMRPDISIVPIRGNVATRIGKVISGEAQATMLAAAGLYRLGLPVNVTLPITEMTPAVGQGIVAFACTRENTELQKLLRGITHWPSYHAMAAERAMLIALNGSCRSPIAAWANVDDAYMILHGYVAATDGSKHARAHVVGGARDAEHLGKALAAKLLEEIPHDAFS